MASEDIKASSNPAVAVIAPSGNTDDIRYVLNPEPPAADEKHGRPDVLAEDPRRLDPDAPLATDSGLADEVVDDVDAQLPDHQGSTIRGGQVATEAKRGAY